MRRDIKFGFVFVEVLIATLALRKMHEIPGEERIGQGKVRMNSGHRQRAIEQVHTFFKVTAFGNRPLSRDGMVTDVCEEQEVSMPVVQSLAEVDTGPVQRVDERSLHQARLVDRAARTVIGARRPLDHPVKYFKLAELRLPG